MSQKILIADDNPEIREVVHVLLENEGFEVSEADNGQRALEACADKDLIILDIMMPEMDGIDACRRIREVSNAPILFLTAKTLEADKEEGFASGGDDYIVKPFSYTELLSRVRALLRRYCVYKGKEAETDGQLLQRQDLKVDTNFGKVYLEEEEIFLTDIEYRILLLLMEHPKKVFSNPELYETIWKEPYLYTANNTIMVHIRNLRKKLKVNPSTPKYIKTVWGKGYRFD